MRCKIGDRAFIVKSLFLANVGRIVEVVDYDRGELDWEVRSEGSPLRGVSRLTGDSITGPRLCISDSHLRPIRDRPGVDESLRNLLLSTG